MRRRGVLAAISIALLAAAPAQAKTFKVTRTADTPPNGCGQGGCTLREAVIAANERPGRDVIELRRGKTYAMAPGGTFENEAADGDFDLLGPTTVRGVKGRATVVASGEFTEKVFDVFGSRATFSRLKLTNGHANVGGAVEAHFGSDLSIVRSVITDSRAGAVGGAIAAADGVDDTLRIANSRLAGNSAAGLFGGGGAVYIAGGTATISNTRIVGNDTELGGTSQGNGGGILVSSGDLTISRSLIRGNRSDEVGGGIRIQVGTVALRQTTVDGNLAGTDGGGVATSGGTTTLRESTVSRNDADDGGGILAEGASEVRLTNSTVAANETTGVGAGVLIRDTAGLTANAVTIARNIAGTGGGGVREESTVVPQLKNSIVGLNVGGGTGSDFSGEVDSGGQNLVSSAADASGFAFGGADILDPDPRIGQLKRNGGPTETIALKAGSPALNSAGSDAPSRDQRGVKRRNPDIGAFER
jgi:fibronectin-binding autotransporter adhesin